MTVTYGEYLKLDQLLGLQVARSDPEEHDETLFIIIHQVYELWFKQILHEIDRLIVHLDSDKAAQGTHQIDRVRSILRTLVKQIDVLETMTPLEFLSFRRFLEDSSGFQSAQFRELECVLGITDTFDLGWFENNTNDYQRLLGRIEGRTVWDAFVAYLDRNGYSMPVTALNRNLADPVEASDDVQRVILAAYRENVMLRSMCESLLDIDEGLQEWRYRHVAMVRRTIGNRHGTGGSSGVAYLESTLFRQAFPDLWQVRALF